MVPFIFPSFRLFNTRCIWKVFNVCNNKKASPYCLFNVILEISVISFSHQEKQMFEKQLQSCFCRWMIESMRLSLSTDVFDVGLFGKLDNPFFCKCPSSQLVCKSNRRSVLFWSGIITLHWPIKNKDTDQLTLRIVTKFHDTLVQMQIGERFVFFLRPNAFSILPIEMDALWL